MGPSIFCHYLPLAELQGTAEGKEYCPEPPGHQWSRAQDGRTQIGGGRQTRTARAPEFIYQSHYPKKVGVIIILFQMREFGSRRYSNSFRNPDEKMVALPLESKSTSSHCLNRVSPVNYPENEFGDPLLSIETGGRVFPT